MKRKQLNNWMLGTFKKGRIWVKKKKSRSEKGEKNNIKKKNLQQSNIYWKYAHAMFKMYHSEQAHIISTPPALNIST